MAKIENMELISSKPVFCVVKSVKDNIFDKGISINASSLFTEFDEAVAEAKRMLQDGEIDFEPTVVALKLKIEIVDTKFFDPPDYR